MVKIFLKLMRFKKRYIIIILFFTLFFTGPHFWQSLNKTEVVNNPVATNHFENLSIEAQAFFVWDVNEEKVIYNFHEEAQLPLASLAKIMTTATILDEASVEKLVTINLNDIKQEGDSGLLIGETWSLKNILELILVSSSNDGASAVASVMNSKNGFIKSMNNKADDLGLKQTYFLNESGLDLNKNISGAYGSAKDVALVFSYVLQEYPHILEATKYKTISINSLDLTHEIKNTNKEIETFPGIIASKTGFTDIAGGNLVIAFDAGLNKPIIISLLGSSIDGRFDDMEKLVWATIKDLNK